MKRQQQRYPIGSVRCGTMRSEDLIPAFVSELEYRLKHGPRVSRETRKAHKALLRDINKRMNDPAADDDAEYFDSEDSQHDLETLFDALDCYAGPYFYFGAHPGDGADYGYWLSESWDEDFETFNDGDFWRHGKQKPIYRDDMPSAIKVNDLADVPKWFRGEVAVGNDHGNVTLYVKTSRALREVWAVV